jgi:hypothetical protein
MYVNKVSTSFTRKNILRTAVILFCHHAKVLLVTCESSHTEEAIMLLIQFSLHFKIQINGLLEKEKPTNIADDF